MAAWSVYYSHLTSCTTYHTSSILLSQISHSNVINIIVLSQCYIIILLLYRLDIWISYYLPPNCVLLVYTTYVYIMLFVFRSTAVSGLVRRVLSVVALTRTWWGSSTEEHSMYVLLISLQYSLYTLLVFVLLVPSLVNYYSRAITPTESLLIYNSTWMQVEFI